MKRFKTHLIVILAVLLTNLTTTATAQSTDEAWLDSVDISLLTCGPGEEVWSYYGHTALRIDDRAHGQDLAVNWGMFSFQQDFFILRFVFGLTDYQMGIIPMTRFTEEYQYQGRWVMQQRLRLSRKEKSEILSAIEENSKPENRTYRYNFFYDNCTTRARDMILSHLDGAGKRAKGVKGSDVQSTYRKEIHRWNEDHRWARFGNDLLLGIQADKSISREEWEFLPENLMQDFAATGMYAQLVDSTFYVLPPHATEEQSETVTPTAVFLTLSVCIILLCAWEWYRKKNFWWLDFCLMVATGVPGLVLLAMVFSEHPTVQANLQILILNPINLLFAWQVAKGMRRGKLHWYYHAWLFLICIFAVMNTQQSYAEGISYLALSLLVRNIAKQKLLKRTTSKSNNQN